MAVVQYTFTHKQYVNNTIDTKQYIEQHNTWNNTIKEECGPCPVFARYTLAFALQLRKKHGKTSVRVENRTCLTLRKHKHNNRIYNIQR